MSPSSPSSSSRSVAVSAEELDEAACTVPVSVIELSGSVPVITTKIDSNAVGAGLNPPNPCSRNAVTIFIPFCGFQKAVVIQKFVVVIPFDRLARSEAQSPGRMCRRSSGTSHD